MNGEVLSKLVEIVFIYIPELILVMLFAVNLLGVKVGTRQIILISIIHGGIVTPVIRLVGHSIAPMHTILLLLLFIAMIIIVTKTDIIASILIGVLTMVTIVLTEYLYFNMVSLFIPSILNTIMSGNTFARVLVFIPLATIYLSLYLLCVRFKITMSLRSK